MGGLESLIGWTLRDRAGNEFPLDSFGWLPAFQQVEFVMLEFSMPLNNAGNDITLLDNEGNVRYDVSTIPSGCADANPKEEFRSAYILGATDAATSGKA